MRKKSTRWRRSLPSCVETFVTFEFQLSVQNTKSVSGQKVVVAGGGGGVETNYSVKL